MLKKFMILGLIIAVFTGGVEAGNSANVTRRGGKRPAARKKVSAKKAPTFKSSKEFCRYMDRHMKRSARGGGKARGSYSDRFRKSGRTKAPKGLGAPVLVKNAKPMKFQDPNAVVAKSAERWFSEFRKNFKGAVQAVEAEPTTQPVIIARDLPRGNRQELQTRLNQLNQEYAFVNADYQSLRDAQVGPEDSDWGRLVRLRQRRNYLISEIAAYGEAIEKIDAKAK
jgi:hypothetical protein